MNFLKPAYILELEVAAGSAPLTDAAAVFKLHSTTMWNYSNTLVETSDKKQMQADWCKINKKKRVAGLSVVDKADPIAKRLHVNKMPKEALSNHRMHFVYITGNACLRLFCVWQFIDDEALTATAAVMAEREDMLELAEAEKAELAAALKKSEAAICALKEQLEKVDAALGEAESKPVETPINIIAGALVQIEQRLSALEGANSCALQLGMILGLSSASASADAPPAEEDAEAEEESASEAEAEDDAESASEAEAEADVDAAPLNIDNKQVTNLSGVNPTKKGDIIAHWINGVVYYVEVNTANNSGITFKLLRHIAGNTFRYAKSKPPAGGNFNYTRRLYKVLNGIILDGGT